ncbi:MAG: AAA family ATPase [Clostridia bacterium]|nr:AAA family ATPase [Clostridia bacterium]
MNNIISALNYLNCADLDHAGWIAVGMALKTEGYDVSVWDEWSAKDADRYHPGECARRWNSFRGSSAPVTGATIVKMAQDRGWIPFAGADGVMDWDDVLEYDGDESDPDPVEPARKGTEDLILYIQTLYEPNDYVGYVTNDAWQTDDGKWVPAKGVYYRTAEELITSLHRYPDDLGATVGDWKPEAGAWIRFNALDGEGVRNENVVSFKFALVESDAMPVDDQISMYRKLELPIAALVHSGHKSVHAIVRVDADSFEEYRKRVTFLYDFLASRGVKVDTQNRNPSRLSRMPGVTRNGQVQKLLGVNIGRKSWVDWMDYVEGATDELPGMALLSDFADNPPEQPEELITGVLRRGHKMLISGSSKAGKSFLLMELCIALAEGISWLGFRCKQGKVLYVNLEIDPASCIHRFLKIYKAMGLKPKHMDDITIWNLRGHAVPLDQLVPKLIRRVRDMDLDAIIIDPIYKVITGDENSASDMAAFCNQFDRICTETACSVIYCHHHSKGAQGGKRAMDRASGSGVFARDPDAQLDMIELELTDEVQNWVAKRGATAWRLEGSLREFENFTPVNFWFEYPLHRLDTNEDLKPLPTQGSADAGRLKSKYHKSTEFAEEEFRTAFQAVNFDGSGSTVSDMAAYMGLAERTIRDRIKKMNGEFILENGMVRMTSDVPDLVPEE